MDGANIGTGTTIGACCFIGENVVIGKNNIIQDYAVIDGYTTIGDGNKIGHHTVLGTSPQDIKTTSHKVKLKIGDNNIIENNVFITAGTDHGGFTTHIGDQNHIMGYVHIGHDVRIDDNCTLEHATALGGHAEVSSHAHFEENTSVHQFVAIGKYARTCVNAAVTQDIPPFCKADGNRAKIVGVNRSIKNHYTKEQFLAIQDAYANIFDSGSPKDNATVIISSNKNRSMECMELYNFIKDSERGIPFKRNINVNKKM